MSKLDEIALLIPGLSKSDLHKLYALIESELQKDLGIDEDLFKIIFDETGQKPTSLITFSKTENGRLWKEGQKGFDKILAELIGDKVYRKTQILALKKILVSMLLDYLTDKKRPINIRNICNALGNFAKVFDHHFPSYRVSGLSHLIMEKITNAR